MSKKYVFTGRVLHGVAHAERGKGVKEFQKGDQVPEEMIESHKHCIEEFKEPTKKLPSESEVEMKERLKAEVKAELAAEADAEAAKKAAEEEAAALANAVGGTHNQRKNR